MSFFRVNGWALPLLDGSPEEERIIGGDFARSYSGSVLHDERFDKRVWRGRTAPVTEQVALAIQGAVRGLGHSWNFGLGFYSSKGLTPGSTVGSQRIGVAADGAFVVDSGNVNEAKYATYSLGVEPAATNILSQNKRDGTEDGTTTGFAVVAGAGISSSTTQKLQGSRSLRVITAALGDGTETTTETASAATTYTGSGYVYVASQRTLRTVMIDSTGANTAANFTAYAGKWTRFSVSHTTAGGANTIRIQLLDQEAGGITYYWDALQIETGAVATTWANATRAAGDLAYAASLVTGACDLTVACWAKMPTANPAAERTILSLAGSGTKLVRPSGANSIQWNGASYATNPWDGTWRHVACVLRRNPETGENRNTIYLDGASVATSSTAAPDLTTVTAVHVGHAAGANRLGAGGDCLVDDLLIVPYAAPSDLVSAWYSMAKAFSALSRVYVDGDAMPEDALTVLAEGRASVSKYLAAHKGGAFRGNLRVVDVELWEA